MSERVECKSEGCKAMILFSTAQRTGGICMPCKQKAERLEYEKFVQENRRDVDQFKDISDPVEILKIMHKPKKYDPLINLIPYKKTELELYSELGVHELERLLKYILENLESDEKKIAFKILKEIAAFTETNIIEIIEILIELSIYYPAYLFRNAGPAIASKLISRINSITHTHNVNLEPGHILAALAWIGTENVIVQFVAWRNSPPNWSNQLNISPDKYPNCAGWELSRQSKRRDLYIDKCYPLIKLSKASEIGPVKTCTESRSTCKWCNRKLTNIFEFDLCDKILDFIPFSGTRLTISTCETCCAYGDQLYMNVGLNGESVWSPENIKPDYLPDSDDTFDRLPSNRLRVSPELRIPHQAVDWCLPVTCSQVGGLPSWIQDFDYGQCPKCNKGMIFIAQLSVADIDDYGEGIFYCLLCPDCSITTVRYQQT